MWEKDIQLEELNTENSASYEEICERYVLSHVPKKDQEGLLGKMDYEKVAEILSYKPEYSFTYESIIVEKKHLCQMKYMRLDDEQHVLMGFRMVDDIVANERAQEISGKGCGSGRTGIRCRGECQQLQRRILTIPREFMNA